MLFNSLEFALFLPVVFVLYWFAAKQNLKLQNLLLLAASYFFYGWWDWRFLFLLVALSLINYSIGIAIEKIEGNRKRKIWLITGLIINLGVLAVFKYYNFFIDGFIDLVSLTGYDLPRSTTKIILPLGISFYVFISLSYIMDIYKKSLQAHKNVLEVLLSLGFFPILLAGPIQRPSTLLPQITQKREFNYSQAVDGLRQILWGLFAKIVIADKLAPLVDEYFKNTSQYSGSFLALGALFFTIQIYADFSGYSNIAIGVAKLLGFKLMQNFAYPYFSRDITEFWKRWHISLTTWFRDYLFLPLSFSFNWRIKGDKVLWIKSDHFIYIAASLMVWFLTGLWHGANYTFIVWGLINGFFLIVYHLQNKPRKKLFKKWGIRNNDTPVVIIETFVTLVVVVFSWVFFRADSMSQALQYILGIFSHPGSYLLLSVYKNNMAIITLGGIFMILEWLGRDTQHALEKLGYTWKRPFRYTLYYMLILAIFWFGGKEQQFIYFQF